ncbi:MAG: glycosyltransferase family 2 protein [Phycisphaerae bacterium]|nr:glycosyltransferase family 2 protein [Phycisphaerae bacterium]
MIDSETLIEIAGGNLRPERLVSIVIPHYRTEELVRLCLRAIRSFTDFPCETIVVDNNSADGSLDYLRGVRWIRLVERGDEVESASPLAHGAAMDIGAAAARGKYLLSFHTDTIVKKPGWLEQLVCRLEAVHKGAALGCGKLETGEFYKALKSLWDTHWMRRGLRRLFGMSENPRYRQREFYPNSYCALYDLTVLRDLNLSFMPTEIYTAGEKLYHDLIGRGYAGVELTVKQMAEYVHHISHATSHLAGGSHKHWRAHGKFRRALERVTGTEVAEKLLNDESLDR